MKLKIRMAEIKDTDFLHYSLNEEKGLRDFDKEEISIEDYPLYWIRGIINYKEENLCLIAEIKNEKVGFLIAHLLKGVKDSILNNIFVIEKHRGIGIGNKLIREYERIIRKKGFKVSLCFINLDNKNAIRFHEENNYFGGYNFKFYQKNL